MKRQCLCFLWLALFLSCLPLHAHEPLQTSFQSYEGLSALGDVRDVAVQPSGGMWLLNNQGDIYFFDGQKSHPLDDTLAFPDEKILTLAYAHQSLWLAGKRDIYRFQPGENTLTRFALLKSAKGAHRENASPPRLAAVNHTLWHIQDGQISRYQVKEDQFRVWRSGQWRGEHTWFTAEHRLVAIGKGLYQLNDEGVRQLTRFTSPITAITAKGDRAWVSTEKGVYLLALSDRSVQAQHRLNTQGGYQRLTVGAGGLWAAHENGLFLLSIGGEAMPVWQPGDPSIPGDAVTFLWGDFEGGVWFSTGKTTRYRAPGQRWISHQHQDVPVVNTQGFMASSDPWSLYPDGWRNLSGDLTLTFDRETVTHRHGATRDRHQLWWSSAAGLHGIRIQSGEKIAVPEPLASLSAQHLYMDADGVIWLALNDRLIRYRPESEKVMNDGTDWQSDAGDILGFYDDGRGSVWIRQRQGLTRYRNGKFQPMPLAEPLLPVVDMYSDEQGRLWLANSKGIYQYDPKVSDSTSVAYLALADEQFRCITGNRDGIWAYSNQALIHIAPRGFVRTFRLPSESERVACFAPRPHQLIIMDAENKYVIETDQLAFSLRKPPHVVVGAIWQQHKRWRIGPRQQTAVTLLEQSPANVSWGSWPPERQVTRIHYQLVPYRQSGQSLAKPLAAWQQTGSDTLSLANMVGGHYQLRIAIPRDGASHTVLDIAVSMPILPHLVSGVMLGLFASVVLAAVRLAFKQQHPIQQHTDFPLDHSGSYPVFQSTFQPMWTEYKEPTAPSKTKKREDTTETLAESLDAG
ncbi:ligand-binding sensor domain-containing protein [Salinivibrio socompensis]|uniref:ligand-binding sensor domain-containing protein n=1 Tax=Salinivibrio socompensis TaxID=1510206 RepID=UPI0004725B98|nr:hypothetical protein [Salinivibrio socompensis]